MQLNPSEISELIKKRLENFDTKVEARTEGTIVSVTDGIVRIHGLSDVMLGEMLEFPGDVFIQIWVWLLVLIISFLPR